MHALVEQNKRLVSAQSTPLLMLDSGNENGGKPDLTMTVSNVGTGPAQIVWFRLVDAEGKDYRGGSLNTRVEQLGSDTFVSSQPISAALIRSGDARSVFEWPKPSAGKPAIAAWDDLNTARFHLHASACYCSIFDECRTTEFGDSRPKPVASCDSGPDHQGT